MSVNSDEMVVTASRVIHEQLSDVKEVILEA